jgi:hypothetical protein
VQWRQRHRDPPSAPDAEENGDVVESRPDHECDPRLAEIGTSREQRPRDGLRGAQQIVVRVLAASVDDGDTARVQNGSVDERDAHGFLTALSRRGSERSASCEARDN